MTAITESLYLKTFGSTNSTLAAANCILDYTKNVCTIKIQKLLFLSYGLHLSLYNQKLYGCTNLAWKSGPAVKKVYEQFKTYKGEINLYYPQPPFDFVEEKMSILAVCRYYGDKKSAAELVDITRSMSSWKKAYESKYKKIIDHEILEDFKLLTPEIVTYVHKLFPDFPDRPKIPQLTFQQGIVVL